MKWIHRCRDYNRKNTQKRLMALNAIRDVSPLDKCVSDHKPLASALAHLNCPPRAGRVLSSLLQQGRSAVHCLEILQRGYRAQYTQNERDFGLLTLRNGGPRLLHAAKHVRCAPSRDQVLPKHKHRPIAYGKTITVKDMLPVLPCKLPLCAYSICVDELAAEGALYHHWLAVHPRCFMVFAWSMQVFVKFKVKVICLPFANPNVVARGWYH